MIPFKNEVTRIMTEKNDSPLFFRGSEPPAKHTAKDSVFTDLFKIPKYLFPLYQALHPEDTETAEEDLTNVTLLNILLDRPYNDIGFRAGERILILVEAQSTWTVNIIIRSLLYLAQSWQEHIALTKQNVYNSRKLKLPRPELYVIYTGDRKSHPETLSLTEEFFHGQESAVEVKIKMIYDGNKGDIIYQYVAFTKIFNQQVRLHGRTPKAVLETIRICKEQDILKEYLEEREQEVITIMIALFDEEYILQTYIEDEVNERVEKKFAEAVRKLTKEVTEEVTRKVTREVTRECSCTVKKQATENNR